jgi:hypothetical protein
MVQKLIYALAGGQGTVLHVSAYGEESLDKRDSLALLIHSPIDLQ